MARHPVGRVHVAVEKNTTTLLSRYPGSLAPATVPEEMLLPFSVVNPDPLPVNVDVPMFTFPNPDVTLPALSAPVPVTPV
jgi:hypothetical protein